MIKDFMVGAKVMITKETFQKIHNSARSIAFYPSESCLNIAKSLIGIKGTVTKRFRPGYEFNVTFPVPYVRRDGTQQDTTILQLKDHWVEPLDHKWNEVK